MPSPIQEPRLFVGVGASAGGIEACKDLFAAMPEDSGLAFIVVLHLDPTHASHIAEILQSHAKQLRVSQADDTVRLDAGHVYVIAPNSKLKLADGTLEVEPLAENEARGQLVDRLFSSLAESEGSRAVGIVLSGAGSDGTEGLRKIKAAGGLTIVEDPDSAASSGMPQSAIDAGLADAVLTAQAIPQALLRFANGGVRPAESAKHVRSRKSRPDHPKGFQRILEQLGMVAGGNFEDYKLGTLERRTLRRMTLKGMDDFESYSAYLDQHPDELDNLYRDVLIGVTEFFRDPDVWGRLRTELPALLESRGQPGLRAWVPGCATGEEAYTLAILCHEALPAAERGKLQIFATDLNERALAVARRGIYQVEKLKAVSRELSERHFNHYDGQLQVDQRIRDCLTFAPHDVLNDPPFSKMDIVSCRNLLIYLKPNAHERLLKRLHFALRKGGLLVLGRSENIGRHARLFEDVSKTDSLYRARAVRRQERFEVVPRTTERVPADERAALPEAPQMSLKAAGANRRLEPYILRHHTPACVVVNPEFEIQNFYGPTERYLVPPVGESRSDLLAWIRPGFYIRLRAALQQAADSGEASTTEGQINRNGEVQRVQCTIDGMPASTGTEGSFLITFQDVGDAVPRKLADTNTDEPLVRELELELLDTRRELQSAIEQLDAAGEEHRAGHEELLSLNEELQSSNEELQASKEELEALNEEMNTINRELEDKNTRLRAANSDLDQLFLSTGIPTVFLDRELNVRRFTPTTTDVMHLVPSDVGRSIEHVKERFPEGQTAQRVRQVYRTLEMDVSEVSIDRKSYIRKILPYRSDSDGLEGVCITFVDITEQKRAIKVRETARKHAEAIIEAVRGPLLVLDQDLRVVFVNKVFQDTFGPGDDLIGRAFEEAGDRWAVPQILDLYRAVLAGDRQVDDYEFERAGRTIFLNARKVARPDESSWIVLSFEDVTDRQDSLRESERQAAKLKEDAKRKDLWIAMLGHELRNPMGAISNGIQLLKAGISSERQRRVVEMMQRQALQMSRLLDDLLDAAKVLAGNLSIERELVDLCDVAHWALDSTRSLVEANKNELSVSLPPPGTVWVLGDGVRLTEIVDNLLTNAVKYGKPGGRILLEVKADADAAIITVQDSGIGISSAFLSRIFDTFTQGPRPAHRAGPGLGIGLSVVRSLVHLHGGRVEASSPGEGNGSTFKVTLPRIHKGRRSTDLDTRPMPKRRILLVDDEPDAADSLRELLETQGHDVAAVTDVADAAAIARQFRPEIALLDLGMPGIDGYELAQQLRDDGSEIVLIAVSGYAEDSERLAASGFDHFVSKPVDIKRLSYLLAEPTR
jgi:two-component system CheB/CheR fusion protein